MADELDIQYGGSDTPYAIIRRESNGYVWNTANSAFEAWANGSITDYDLSLTSQGGGYYTGDFPAAITDGGWYLINYRVRAGASPTISDQSYPSERIYWNGTEATDAPPGDLLVSLDRVKTYLGITGTDHDDQLTDIISAASRGVENWCDRTFASANYTEYHDGRDAWRRSYLSLRQYPITAISRVATRPVCAMLIKNTDTTTNQRATVSLSSTNLTLRRTASGSVTTNNLLLATYTTLTALGDAVDALGNGWDAEVQGNSNDYGKWPSSDLKVIQGAVNAREEYGGASLYLYADELDHYVVNDDIGTLHGAFPAGVQNIEVKYTAGYSEIPEAVQQGALHVVQALYASSGLDPNLRAEKIGDYSYQLRSGEMNMDAPMFGEARFFLQRYRRLRMLCQS